MKIARDVMWMLVRESSLSTRSSADAVEKRLIEEAFKEYESAITLAQRATMEKLRKDGGTNTALVDAFRKQCKDTLDALQAEFIALDSGFPAKLEFVHNVKSLTELEPIAGEKKGQWIEKAKALAIGYKTDRAALLDADFFKNTAFLESQEKLYTENVKETRTLLNDALQPATAPFETQLQVLINRWETEHNTAMKKIREACVAETWRIFNERLETILNDIPPEASTFRNQMHDKYSAAVDGIELNPLAPDRTEQLGRLKVAGVNVLNEIQTDVDAAKQRQEEGAKEEAQRKRFAEEEAHLKKLTEEAHLKKLTEEAHLKKLEEEHERLQKEKEEEQLSSIQPPPQPPNLPGSVTSPPVIPHHPGASRTVPDPPMPMDIVNTADRQQEEAQRKTEQEAQRKAAEAQRKAAEAHRKAEQEKIDEARKKQIADAAEEQRKVAQAEEERKAQEEARRKSDDEARKKQFAEDAARQAEQQRAAEEKKKAEEAVALQEEEAEEPGTDDAIMQMDVEKIIKEVTNPPNDDPVPDPSGNMDVDSLPVSQSPQISNVPPVAPAARNHPPPRNARNPGQRVIHILNRASENRLIAMQNGIARTIRGLIATKLKAIENAADSAIKKLDDKLERAKARLNTEKIAPIHILQFEQYKQNLASVHKSLIEAVNETRVKAQNELKREKKAGLDRLKRDIDSFRTNLIGILKDTEPIENRAQLAREIMAFKDIAQQSHETLKKELDTGLKRFKDELGEIVDQYKKINHDIDQMLKAVANDRSFTLVQKVVNPKPEDAETSDDEEGGDEQGEVDDDEDEQAVEGPFLDPMDIDVNGFGLDDRQAPADGVDFMDTDDGDVSSISAPVITRHRKKKEKERVGPTYTTLAVQPAGHLEPENLPGVIAYFKAQAEAIRAEIRQFKEETEKREQDKLLLERLQKEADAQAARNMDRERRYQRYDQAPRGWMPRKRQY